MRKCHQARTVIELHVGAAEAFEDGGVRGEELVGFF
jgi:hypothetical protein